MIATTYLGPNNNEPYDLLVMRNTLGLVPRGELWRRSTTGRRVVWRCSLWQRGLCAALGRTIHDLVTEATSSMCVVQTIRDGARSSSSPSMPRSRPLGRDLRVLQVSNSHEASPYDV